jgi:SAM-dependent methyltransferase
LALPDVDRLLAIAPTLRGLGVRLAAVGLAAPFVSRLARVGDRLDDALRAPMRIWNARRMSEPAATAARLFMLHDPVSPAEAHAALGDCMALREAGLVEDSAEGIVCRYHLALAAGAYCFGDRPEGQRDAVMPICGATLDLVRASLPRDPIDAALDVGCGAGAVGLLLARVARRVVATDVNERAATFTRVNAAVNGVENIEVRCGDLFEAVAGERFGRIAAHPPFLAQRSGACPKTFSHGGVRGDELALRLIAGVAPLLERGGRAVILADWPLVDGDALDARVRAALGDQPTDVLVLQSPPKNLDEYCAFYAAVEHAELGDDFARAAFAQRDHLDELRLRGIALAIVVVEPVELAEAAAQPTGFTSLVGVRHLGDSPITAGAIDRLVGAHRLAHRGGEAIGGARLRLPEGATPVIQELPDGASPAVVLKLPAGRPEWPVVLDPPSAALLRRIAEAPTVLDAARLIASEDGTSVERQWTRVEAVARDGLLRGALDISSDEKR